MGLKKALPFALSFLLTIFTLSFSRPSYAAVSVSPNTTQDFGTIDVGAASSPVVFTVTISGLAEKVVGVDLDDNVNYTITADNCPGKTTTDASCTFSVRFNPTSAGVKNSSVRVTSVFDIKTVSLTGTGADNPVAVVNPSAMDFGTIGVGSTSEPLTAIVTNTGSTDLTITANPSISGADAAQFAILNPANACVSGTVLSPGESCPVEVTHSPNDTIADTASLDIPTDDVNLAVVLSGNGLIGPGVALNPSSLSFGSIGVGNSSDPQIVQLTNNGTSTLNVTSLSLATGTDFEIIGNTCDGQALAVNAGCVFQVVFRPTTDTPNPLMDSVDIVSDASTSPDSLAVDGTGVFGPAVVLIPDPMTFPDPQVVGTTSEVRLVTVHSTGTTPVENLTIGALDSGVDFRILQDACSGLTLPVGSNCAVLVTFTPTTTGALSDFFMVSADNGVSEQADLNGTGVQSAISSSGTGVFGTVNVGSQGGPNTITVTNTSTTASLNIGSLQQVGADPDQFAIANDNCSNAVLAPSPGPGNTCTFQAQFNPTAAGVFTDSVQIPNDSATPNFSVALSGTGLAPGVALAQFNPSVIDFDLTLPETGSASEVQTTTITNVGTSNLTITSLALGGVDAGAFSQTNNCDGNTLAAGDSCTATVTFATALGGDFNATLMVTSNSAGTPFAVLLGSARSDATGGGCSLNRASQAQIPLAGLACFGLGLVGAVWLRRRDS